MKNLNEITAALQTVGNLTETARLKGRTLNPTERDFVANVRKEARQRLSPQMQNAIENEGAAIVRTSLSGRRILPVLLAVLALGLASCQHSKARMTSSVDEKTYCAEHPSECVLTANDGTVRS